MTNEIAKIWQKCKSKLNVLTKRKRSSEEQRITAEHFINTVRLYCCIRYCIHFDFEPQFFVVVTYSKCL